MRPIAIDTGPLLTYLALRYLDRSDAPTARRNQVLKEIRQGHALGDTQREQFLKLMKRPVFTTAHVISEALNLRGKSVLNREKEEFRRNSLDVLTSGSISEIPCRITDVCLEQNFRELICRHGLTDAGLLFVASKRRALVLTDDARLFTAYSSNPGYVIELLTNHLR
jgi:predicted nucleic acid-binding protein